MDDDSIAELATILARLDEDDGERVRDLLGLDVTATAEDMYSAIRDAVLPVVDAELPHDWRIVVGEPGQRGPSAGYAVRVEYRGELLPGVRDAVVHMHLDDVVRLHLEIFPHSFEMVGSGYLLEQLREIPRPYVDSDDDEGAKRIVDERERTRLYDTIRERAADLPLARLRELTHWIGDMMIERADPAAEAVAEMRRMYDAAAGYTDRVIVELSTASLGAHLARVADLEGDLSELLKAERERVVASMRPQVEAEVAAKAAVAARAAVGDFPVGSSSITADLRRAADTLEKLLEVATEHREILRGLAIDVDGALPVQS